MISFKYIFDMSSKDLSNISPEMMIGVLKVPQISGEHDFVSAVDFSRKRCVFFFTGPISIVDICWILSRITECSRLIIHQWQNLSTDSDLYYTPAREAQKSVSDNRLTISSSQDFETSVISALAAIDRDVFDSWQPIILSKYLRENSNLIMPVLRQLGEYLNLGILATNTKIAQTGDVIKNALINLPRADLGNSLKNYVSSHKNVPSIIVAAGPSLSKQLDLLFQYQDYFHIIAVDSIWELLISRGIVPDVLIALDPANGPKWSVDSWNTSTTLFADLGCNPELVNSLPYQSILTCGSPATLEFSTGIGAFTEFLRTGGSVATSGFSLASLLGSNPTILVGQDLALTDGRDHVDGHAYAYSSSFLNSQIDGGFDIDGYFGDRVRTEKQLLVYKVWLEKRIEEISASRLIINSTEGGAKISGSLQIPFADVCREISKVGLLKTKNVSRIQPFDSSHLSMIKMGIIRIINNSKSLLKTCDIAREVIKATGSKNFDRQIIKIDRHVESLRSFDRIAKILVDTIGVAGFEHIRRDAARSINKDKKIDTALAKYDDLFSVARLSSEYVLEHLKRIDEYFDALLDARQHYLPELAKAIWK